MLQCLTVYKKFCGGPGGGFSKEPPGRRRQMEIATEDTEVTESCPLNLLTLLNSLTYFYGEALPVEYAKFHMEWKTVNIERVPVNVDRGVLFSSCPFVSLRGSLLPTANCQLPTDFVPSRLKLELRLHFEFFSGIMYRH